MNGFDIAALVAVIVSARRGFANGLAAEFYRLFRMAVALFAGTSLYGVLSHAVTGILGVTSGFADPALFAGSAIVVWRLLHRLRRAMEAWLLAAVPRKAQAIGGALAAALKCALLIGGVVTLFNLASWLPGHDAVASDSAVSALMRPFLSRQ